MVTTHHYNTSQFSALHQLGFESTRSSYYGLYTDDISIRKLWNDQLISTSNFILYLPNPNGSGITIGWKVLTKFRFTGTNKAPKGSMRIAPDLVFPLQYLSRYQPKCPLPSDRISKGYYLDVPIKYNQSKASVQIQLSDVRNKFKYKLGASAQYVIGDEKTAKNDIFIYLKCYCPSYQEKKYSPTSN